MSRDKEGTKAFCNFVSANQPKDFAAGGAHVSSTTDAQHVNGYVISPTDPCFRVNIASLLLRLVLDF